MLDQPVERLRFARRSAANECTYNRGQDMLIRRGFCTGLCVSVVHYDEGGLILTAVSALGRVSFRKIQASIHFLCSK